MTKMAAMPINGKNHKNFFSGTGGPISTKLGVYHQGLWPIVVYINHGLGLTLTYFMARSIWLHRLFNEKKNEIIEFFRKFCDL